MYSRCVTVQIHSTKLSQTLNNSQFSPTMKFIYSNVAIYFALILMAMFLWDSPLLLISTYQAIFFAVFALKMYRDVHYRKSAKAKTISRLLALSYVVQLIYVLIVVFYSSSLDNIVFYYDPVALLESPFIVISIVQTLLLALFISKLYNDLAFRTSRRAKWMFRAFALICLLEIIYAAQAITFRSENPTERISLYYQKAQSDLEKPSSGLEHALGEDDGFDLLQDREQVTLLTNAVLKPISEVQENKSPDFKAAGVEWFGEKEKALYWKSVLKEAEDCFSSGFCGSALTLVDTILGREEVEQAADLAGGAGESHPDPDVHFSVSWKKVALCGLTIFAGYSVYRGEMPIPAQVRNLYESWKGVMKSTLEERVYSRLKSGSK
jgi:hypothetical protein